ncbi:MULTISPECIES: PaaI family thioesterase [unclassified Sphingomonas]|uniref:PaaI family thioesterase n=1 Tax=unclassified Sphingomonas TaxID=196159 RepID=UPI0006FA7C58|nr:MULTISPECIES: PaaI family thioesterase [unclassified Sphingomonas]KQX20169.1 phenylacetic acid degradation protein [Sphingomonas sp. Root1294]KQY67419.1 phenylacetic acid degradation protein [Sphingomonas sp. Root50]KRB90795.1 phenylacetic acid degradation protein [Sphingomonas sp. Root720]
MTDWLELPHIKRLMKGHANQLGLRYVDHGDDWAELGFDYDPRLAMNAENGVLASGPVISLIDSASGLSIVAKLKKARPMATLDLRIDYMRAAPPGRSIIARATCYKVTRNVAFVRCSAHDGDPADPVAHSLASFFFTGD